jgi:hypothetical protein
MGTSKILQRRWRGATSPNDWCSVNHQDFRWTSSRGLIWVWGSDHIRSIAVSLLRMRCLDGTICRDARCSIRPVKIWMHSFKRIFCILRSSTRCREHIRHRGRRGAYMLRSTLGHAQQMERDLLDHVLVGARPLSHASTSLSIQNIRVGDCCVQAEKEKLVPPFLRGNVRTISCSKLILHVNPPHILRIARLDRTSSDLSHRQPHSSRNLQPCLNGMWTSRQKTNSLAICPVHCRHLPVPMYSHMEGTTFRLLPNIQRGWESFPIGSSSSHTIEATCQHVFKQAW